jgi:hypothetical protein
MMEIKRQYPLFSVSRNPGYKPNILGGGGGYTYPLPHTPYGHVLVGFVPVAKRSMAKKARGNGWHGGCLVKLVFFGGKR